MEEIDSRARPQMAASDSSPHSLISATNVQDTQVPSGTNSPSSIAIASDGIRTPPLHVVDEVQDGEVGNEANNATAETLLTQRPHDKDTQNKPVVHPQIPLLKQNKHISRRIGRTSTAILLLGTLVVLASFAFLSFLWFSDSRNGTWQKIATRSWMTRAVTLTALAVRTAVSLQAAVATSMLAALALERSAVPTAHLASVSIMRDANSGPQLLAWLLSKASFGSKRPGSLAFFLPLISILVLTTLLTQFASTALVADLSLTPTMGSPASSTLSSHFVYNKTDVGAVRTLPFKQVNRGSAWLKNPAFYSVFAEYSEAPVYNDPAVVDSGRLLRAFLPLQDQQTRYNIGDYKGVATVVDGRVICIRPNLTSPALRCDGIEDSNNDTRQRFALTATLTPAVRIASITEANPNTYNSPYGCLIDPFGSAFGVRGEVWRMSLCAVDDNKALPSEFNNDTEYLAQHAPGSEYLVLNVSSGTIYDWFRVVNITTWDLPNFTTAFLPVRQEENGEWLELFFDKYNTTRLSVSLCYAAMDSADLYVHAFSDLNRTEPVPPFNTRKGRYQFGEIQRQYGQTADGSWTQGMFEDRGILQLERRSNWKPGSHPGDYVRPIVQNFSDDGPIFPWSSFLFSSTTIPGPGVFDMIPELSTGDFNTNWTVYLDFEQSGVQSTAADATHYVSNIFPDPSYSSLLQDIVRSGGNIAHAISSLITLLCSSAYYDHLGQFNGKSVTEQALFVLVLTPQHHRGCVAVLVVVSVHLILTAITVILFLKGTEVSSIGNAWQTIAQVLDYRTKILLESNTLATDSEVVRWMKDHDDTKVPDQGSDKAGSSNSGNEVHASTTTLRPRYLVGIRIAENGTRTELVTR